MNDCEYTVLYDAYKNYLKTGKRQFYFSPKNPDNFFETSRVLSDLLEDGLVENVSDNLLNARSFWVSDIGSMTFDITPKGINVCKTYRKR